MRCYLNDRSIQGQFASRGEFEQVIWALIKARHSSNDIRQTLFTTKSVGDRSVMTDLSFKRAMQITGDVDLKRAVLGWLDKTGPFAEDDTWPEENEYFECFDTDVTYSGLAEAVKHEINVGAATSFSFSGGVPDFGTTPLSVDHGLPGARLGRYEIPNYWTIDGLRGAIAASRPLPDSWRSLVEYSRIMFVGLSIPDAVFENKVLSREPFDAIIRDRALTLLGHLDRYVLGLNPDGSEGDQSRKVIADFFTGERALFTGESPPNKASFKNEMTFPDPEGGNAIFAHYHGKISHRFFRLHFEWPVPAGGRLKVLYLGPKLTKG